jgi:hypothetical protein
MGQRFQGEIFNTAGLALRLFIKISPNGYSPTGKNKKRFAF